MPIDDALADLGQAVFIPTARIENLQDYIILPAKDHGSYFYPDLLVAQHRLQYDQDVARLANVLHLKDMEMSQENNGVTFISNINWEQALKLNLELGNITLNPRQFIDFLILLKEFLDKKKNVYNGLGKIVDDAKILQIYDELIGQRSPYRAEFLDAEFKKIDGKLHVNYNHKNVNGNLIPQRSEFLETCLLEDNYFNLYTFNLYGLPVDQYSNGIYCNYPRENLNSVARFRYGGTIYDKLNLDYLVHHSSTWPGLGIRAAKYR